MEVRGARVDGAVVDLLGAGRDVRLVGKDGRRVLDRRKGFEGRSALGLRPQRIPEMKVAVVDVRGLQAVLCKPHEQALQGNPFSSVLVGGEWARSIERSNPPWAAR